MADDYCVVDCTTAYSPNFKFASDSRWRIGACQWKGGKIIIAGEFSAANKKTLTDAGLVFITKEQAKDQSAAWDALKPKDPKSGGALS